MSNPILNLILGIEEPEAKVPTKFRYDDDTTPVLTDEELTSQHAIASSLPSLKNSSSSSLHNSLSKVSDYGEKEGWRVW